MIWCGIDVGSNTGLAVWDGSRREFTLVATLPLWKALQTVASLAELHKGDFAVVFEDARKRTWLPQERNVSEYRGRLMGAGSVKRDSVIWQEFLQDNGIPFQHPGPRKGMTKWKADTFAAVTGYRGRTSEHARDAALLVFGR
jgi:hypothetical protein